MAAAKLAELREKGFARFKVLAADFEIEFDAEARRIREGDVTVTEKGNVAPHVLADPVGFDEVVFDAEETTAGGRNVSGGDSGECAAIAMEGGRAVMDLSVLGDLLELVHAAAEHDVGMNDVAGLMVDELAGLFEAEHLADTNGYGATGADLGTGIGIHDRSGILEPQ